MKCYRGVAAVKRVDVLSLALLTTILAGTPAFPALERAITRAFELNELSAAVDIQTMPPDTLAAPGPGPQPALDLPAPGRLRFAAVAPLYASFLALYALDLRTTVQALNAGGVEANPLLRNIVGNRAGFVALKAVATTGVIVVTEHMRARGRLAPFVIMAAVNSAYAIVVANNYRTIDALRRQR